MRHREVRCSALALVAIACATPALVAGPPAATQAEIDARLARHREEMSRLHEGERLRADEAKAQEQLIRDHHERQAAVRDALETHAGEVPLAEQSRFDGFDFSLGMLQDPAPSAPGAPAAAPAGDSDLASQATNPVAPLIQLQFQYQYAGESNSGDGSSNVFTIQPVIPWKIGKQAMLSRITIPFVATARFPDPVGREYGLGDIVAINFATKTIGKGTRWQGMAGPGVAFTFPTATSDFTGEGKWQAGPGFVYLNTATPNLQWGAFGYQQWSFASSGGDDDRPEVSKLFFQPLITVHFDAGLYVSLGDILWSIDWNDDDRWSLPVGMRFGKVTKLGSQPVNLFVEPFYDMSGNNKGNEWGVKVNLTLLFPA